MLMRQPGLVGILEAYLDAWDKDLLKVLPEDPDHWMKYFTMKHYQPQDVVFSPGDAPETMYFLATGAFDIVTEVAHPTSERPFWIPSFIPYNAAAAAPKRVRLSVIGQAGIAGEVNFFVGAPRYYGAVASAETLCYVLTRCGPAAFRHPFNAHSSHL